MENIKTPTIQELNKTFASFITEKPSLPVNQPVKTEEKPDEFLSARKQDKKKFGPLAYIMTGTGLIGASAIGFFLLNGRSAKFTRFMKRQINALELKVAENKYLNKTNSFVNGIYKKISIGMTKTLAFFGNLSPIKDMFCDKVLRKIDAGTEKVFKKSFLKRTADWFTEKFKVSHIKYTAGRYTKAKKSLNELQKTTNAIADEIVDNYAKLGLEQKQAKEIAEKIRTTIQKASVDFGVIEGEALERTTKLTELIKKIARPNWDQEILTATKGKGDAKNPLRWLLNDPNAVLKDTSDKKYLEKLNRWTEYIPTKITEKEAKEFYKPLTAAVASISNNSEDLYKVARNYLDDIIFTVDKNNPNVRKSYVKIKELIDHFRNPRLDGNLAERMETKTGIISEFKNLKNVITEIDPKHPCLSKFDELEQIIAQDKKGYLEEIASTLNSVPQLKQKYKTAYMAAHKNIKYAFNGEVSSFYGKAVDMELGSIPTDLGGLAIPFALAGLAYANSHNKHEKDTVTLTGTLPAIGGVGAAIVANLKQYSGLTGLVFGAVVGLGLSKIGSLINKKYNPAPQPQMIAQNQTPVQNNTPQQKTA